MGRAIVLGGTGEMGRRVARLIREEDSKIEVVVASRRGDVFADVQRPQTVADLLSPGDALIDAVGPYRHDPTTWIRHALEIGAHVIDLCEAHDFQARARAAVPSESRGALFTGCSTTPGLVEALLPLLGGGARNRVLLSMGSANEVSPGLLYGLLRPLGRVISSARGRAWRTRVVKKLADGRVTAYGSFPAIWDATEEGPPIAFYAGFDRRLWYWPLWMASLVMPCLSDSLLHGVCRVAAPLLFVVRALGTPRGALSIEAQDDSGRVLAEIQIHAASDGLDVPALPAAWAAAALLKGAEVRGAAKLGDLFSPEEVLARLENVGDQITVHRLGSGGVEAKN